jgi:hypothetical protein
MTNLITEGVILQEAQIVKSDATKAIFRMVMQTADEVNQNKRKYPQSVLSEGMKNCEDRIKNRRMEGELDHPVPSGAAVFDGVRQTTVLLKEASHLIRDYEWEGNRLIGELETLSTPNGKTLLALLKDRVGIGLSMRGMAELEHQRDIKIVKGPLYIITFDAVSTPSHKSATVNFSELRFESKNLITEGCNSGVVCTPDGKCYLPDYFQYLVEHKIITFLDRWI